MNSLFHKMFQATLLSFALAGFSQALVAAENTTSPDYKTQIAPIFRKYCVGCHNADDAEGKLALDTLQGTFAGGENGKVITPGDSKTSRMIQMLLGQAEPAMPPEDNEGPSKQEISLLQAWIDSGAKASSDPVGVSPIIDTPQPLRPLQAHEPINDLAVSPDGKQIALAHDGHVQILSEIVPDFLRILNLGNTNVNAVSFSSDGKYLVTAAGQIGLRGEAKIWNLAATEPTKVFQGHKDSLYAARLSPDGKLLATSSYDKLVKIWEVASGKELHTLGGHNAAVFDVAFHPQGKILATASGDSTVKLWDIVNGQRLDTFGQPLKEMYTVTFHPDGTRLAAAGADNRIRIWQISKSAKEGTNPQLISRFAHEAPILRLVYMHQGRTLVSTAEDQLIKVWNADEMTARRTLKPQSDWSPGLAATSAGHRLWVGRQDGTREVYKIDQPASEVASKPENTTLVQQDINTSAKEISPEKLAQTVESEPNNSPSQATPLTVPGVATGKIHSQDDTESDVDLFRFRSQANQPWILEILAARDHSLLDSKIEVLSVEGLPIERLQLQAVRDSEITFRGIHSDTLDVRVTNWEEMELNQYLFFNGELVKIHRMPRGPDSGFVLYPGSGKRIGYFDTSARAHALFTPAYVVVPYAPQQELPNNGLPVFTINYENDDDSNRKQGRDSKLLFVAPTEGDYFVRVSDVRGISGEKFHYRLTVRPPRPDFKVTLQGDKPKVNQGSGKSFSFQVDRLDYFTGPIEISITGVPAGYQVTSPLTIQAEQLSAQGVLTANPDALVPTEEILGQIKITATAIIQGEPIAHEVKPFEKIEIAEAPKVTVSLEPLTVSTTSATKAKTSTPEIVIVPGTTTTCKLKVTRNGFDDRISFDIKNLPHGVIVDNIGLSGVLIPKGQTERTLYLTAADWVPETSRLFHAVAKVDGNQASLPMILHVRRLDQTAEVNSSK